MLAAYPTSVPSRLAVCSRVLVAARTCFTVPTLIAGLQVLSDATSISGTVGVWTSLLAGAGCALIARATIASLNDEPAARGMAGPERCAVRRRCDPHQSPLRRDGGRSAIIL